MTTTDRKPVGELAYRERLETGATWLEIADRLAYRVGESNHLRQQALVRLAKVWSTRRGEPWPVGSAVKAVKSRSVAVRLADLEQQVAELQEAVKALKR